MGKLILFLAAGFGSGWSPWAPGTFGSLVAVPIAFGCSRLGPWGIPAAAVFITAIAVPLAHFAGKRLGSADHRSIVVDEFAGYLVTLAAVPWSWTAAIAGFFVFRVLDIAKPWPASYFDKRVKNGFGVVMDDVAAAGYGALALYAAHRFGWL